MRSSRWRVRARQHGVGHMSEDARQCVRALVHVIRNAHQDGSPVDGDQLDLMRKVLKLLSLSDSQLLEMPAGERETVLAIRHSAIQKMKLAQTLGSSHLHQPPLRDENGNVCISSDLLCKAQLFPDDMCPAPTPAISPRVSISSSPQEDFCSSIGSHSLPSAIAAMGKPCLPSSYPMQGMPGMESMPPPAFYQRKPTRHSASFGL